MKARGPITREQFVKRLASLCLRSGLVAFPKDEADQHILLKSAVLLAGEADSFTEQAISERLQLWTEQVCPIQNFDRVSLRRWLVDTGYLTRSSDGARYQISRPGPHADLFDAAVDQVDVLAALAEAREEMARRKREYLEKSKGA